MKRILAMTGLVVSLGAVFGTVPAGAGPSNDVTFTLSCDRGVTATVDAQFVVNSEGFPPPGVSNLTCDGRRVSVPLALPETAVIVTKFDVSTVAGGCADSAPQPLPVRIDCGGKVGAKLTVR